MAKPFGFEKPLGMRDTLPSLHEVKTKLRKRIMERLTGWGYRMLETPALEYYDTVGEATAINERQLFKLLDQQGKTLVLRPDMTAPIARIVASALRKEATPLRLAYDTHVFRAQRHEGGNPSEFEQIGIELIGDGSASADAEVLALMAEALKQASLPEFQIAVGHIGYVNLLLSEIVANESYEEQLRRFLYEKNVVGFRQFARELPLSASDHQRLLGLLSLRGGRGTLAAADTLIHSKQGKKMVAELTVLFDILEDYGVSHHVAFDFTLISHMDYYTGIVYEGYNGKLGFPLASGGRYDELLGKFQRPAPATGFGIFFDRLIEAAGSGGEKPQSCCIIYTPKHRKKALDRAQTKRNNGESAVLQERSTISDIEAFTARFCEVVYEVDNDDKEAAE